MCPVVKTLPAVTATASNNPKVSTTICRLQALDLLAAVIAETEPPISVLLTV